MNLAFPSRDFDDAVAAVCHGTVSDEQARALNDLLRRDPAARDEYILRVELHARLASEPDLFAAGQGRMASQEKILPLVPPPPPAGRRKRAWLIALAACVTFLAVGWRLLQVLDSGKRKGTTSQAVAMLGRVVDAEWEPGSTPPHPGAALEPGSLRLKSGLAQIVFYSGARVVIEGPAELQLISPSEVSCPAGRLTADVPPQAHGFRVNTPQMKVTDLGTAFGLDVKPRRTELHVFKGIVEFQPPAGTAKQELREGAGAVAESSQPPKLIIADPAAFASLFKLRLRSSAAEVLQHEQWRAASRRLDDDPSLLLHFDFEQVDPADWLLPNTSSRQKSVPDGTIVGCQWVEGRWPDKRALEFRGVSDRVRVSVPGSFDAITLAAWVRVQGLDRQFNSLFMCDGFAVGTVHWLIRNDGVLGLTAIGSGPGNFQILASPPVLDLDQFGIWLHLAVVVDGKAKRVVEYVNGTLVSEKALKVAPPYRIGVAELGNWNASGFPGNDPSLIRNFSGAMDELCLFSRALDQSEVRALYSVGKPQPDL
jgi:ferric-dicitrate binding protein FerR (iron transport regulator)